MNMENNSDKGLNWIVNGVMLQYFPEKEKFTVRTHRVDNPTGYETAKKIEKKYEELVNGIKFVSSVISEEGVYKAEYYCQNIGSKIGLEATIPEVEIDNDRYEDHSVVTVTFGSYSELARFNKEMENKNMKPSSGEIDHQKRVYSSQFIIPRTELGDLGLEGKVKWHHNYMKGLWMH